MISQNFGSSLLVFSHPYFFTMRKTARNIKKTITKDKPKANPARNSGESFSIMGSGMTDKVTRAGGLV